MFLTVFSKFVPIMLLFSLGAFFRTKSYISESTFIEVKKLIVNLFLPSLLFISFSNTYFERKHFVIVAVMFFLCLVLLFIGRLFQKIYNVNSKYYPLLFTGFEAGMLGYSLFAVFYGIENIAKFAIVDLGQVTFVFFVMVGILNKLRENQLSWDFRRFLINFFKTPVIIAIFSGIILKSTGIIEILNRNIILSSFIETLKMLSQLTVPFILLTIGYELKFKKENFNLVIKTVLTRAFLLIIFGLLVNKFLIVKLLNLDNIFQKAVMTMFLLPSPFVIPLYMREKDKEEKNVIANTLALNTTVTMILFFIVNLIS